MHKSLAVTALWMSLLHLNGTVGHTYAADGLGDIVRLIEAGKPGEAAKRLKPLAEGGNVEAQYHLGLLAYSGKGVREDEVEAVKWLSAAAKKGHLDAMYQLGNAYTFGARASTMVKDPDVEAAHLYYQAASEGHADAAYSLGLLFLAGKGVIRDDKEAMRWMRMAAQKGHKDAQSYVGTK